MEEEINKLLEELKSEKSKSEVLNEIDGGISIYQDMLLEALTCDDEKVGNVGQLIIGICNTQQFTPFELSSMSATLICEACSVRAKSKGVESTREFFKHLMSSLEQTVAEVFEEMENDSEDGD